MTIKEVEKFEKEFTEKAQKYYDEYQETGMNGKYNSYVKYDDLANICRLAIQQLNNNEGRSSQRYNNYSAYLDRFVDDRPYSLSEVKEMVWKTLGF